MIYRYEFFNDPEHGWLKVKRSELISLGIIDQVSHYSYQRGDYVYLEEDCDASLFIAKKSDVVGRNNLYFRERNANSRSRIRSYESFNA